MHYTNLLKLLFHFGSETVEIAAEDGSIGLLEAELMRKRLKGKQNLSRDETLH